MLTSENLSQTFGIEVELSESTADTRRAHVRANDRDARDHLLNSIAGPAGRKLSVLTPSGADTTNTTLSNKEVLMKTGIHPDYAPVVFRDLASGATFLTRSTVSSDKTIEWEDGNTYPVIDVEISSESHPFYTGKQRIMDSAGRVEKFNSRYKSFGK